MRISRRRKQRETEHLIIRDGANLHDTDYEHPKNAWVLEIWYEYTNSAKIVFYANVCYIISYNRLWCYAGLTRWSLFN